MKRKIYFLLISVLITCGISAQRENSRWYFGANAGMDFMNLTTRNATDQNGATISLSGVPTPLVGPISTWEGCFTLCDRNGDFLFASDGMTVYNGTSNTNIMKNGTGLYGNPSSAQSGVIVPHPGNPNHYFIISSDASDSSGKGYGICYSEVDLSVTNENGRGEVIQKNIKMNITGYSHNEAYEGVAAYPKKDESGYWIVNRTRNYFFVWEITKTGVNTTPVKRFAIGKDPGQNYSITATGSIGLGHTKFSSDGTLLANSAWGKDGTSVGSWITVANFDSEIGDITNIATKFIIRTNATTPTTKYGVFYGIEFSPNGDYLYFTMFQRENIYSDIWRIKRADYSTLAWERVWDNHPVRLVNIGLGPDNRMYGICGSNTAVTTWPYLVVFLNPDEGATEYAIINNYFTYPNVPMWGLPNFMYAFSSVNDITATPPVPCINQPTELSIQVATGTGPDAVTKLVWDFGDGSPAITETDMNQLVFSQTHTYTKRGNYTISITPYKIDNSIITSKVKTLDVKASSCKLPVNHNISAMGYYD